jgi:glyoxylase-like metal-dependent hydrolase (beta-lactamase superfamily II)
VSCEATLDAPANDFMTATLNLPGLHVFERGWLSANNILLTDPHSATLVDSGYVTHQVQTLALVQAVLKDRPLDRLVNTHLHSDHCGGNAILQSHYPEIQTFIPPGESKAVLSWDLSKLSYEPTGQLCPRFHFNDVLKAGSTLRMAHLDWQVLAAPGHDPHSFILFEPSHRVLMSADALWASGFGVVFPEMEGQAAFHEVAATLDLIESLQPRWVIPGHGAVFADVAGALNVARKKLEGFVANPEKHARYGAKVLMKYKMLEYGQANFSAFLEWAQHVRYLKVLHHTYAPDISMHSWLKDLLADLARSHAIVLEDDLILNV